MTWQRGDLYQCVNAECQSKVLVLQPPRSEAPASVAPRCVCGQELRPLPHGVEDPLKNWVF